MKIKFEITLDVDPQVWADAWGVEVGEVREDVRSYIRHNVIFNSRAVESGLVTVVK